MTDAITMTKTSGKWIAKIGDRILASGKDRMNVFTKAQSIVVSEEAKATSVTEPTQTDLQTKIALAFFAQQEKNGWK